MKRVLTAILCLILCCGCSDTAKKQDEKITETVGMWITYSELSAMSRSSGGFAAAFTEAVEKAKQCGINTLFVHTRAFCDAVYKSDIFPRAAYIEAGTDALGVMTDIAHQNGLTLHAWINPYRVSTSVTDISALPDGSPAKIWLTDSDPNNDRNVCITEGGIYLSPASPDVKKLILEGVREIIENYDVDGIHIDDYFYPTTEALIDEAFYSEYTQSVAEPIPLEHWRRKNVSSLVNSIYCTVKAHDNGLRFGVSPAADLDRCYNTLYADIEGWIGGGYIDYIMPQLYFGFEYPDQNFRFDNLLTKWLDLTEGKGVELYIGLANYKIGTDSVPDAAEWGRDTDIIARQIDLIRENGGRGFVFFSYSSLFSENELNKQQYNNIKQRMN